MEEHTDSDTVHRELDTNGEDPGIQVAETVAELESTETTELPTMYGCIDGMLDHLFSNPPSPEAQMEVTFCYAGYRITVWQDGTAAFVET